MMKEYDISVIMGVYNCSKTLSEALDSLYCQTFNNFKIIMCDDGSTDDSYEIMLSYTKQYNNIVLLKNQKNEGLSYALNKCLECADTKYVARMDGDDISLPSRFEKEYNFLESHPEYAIVSSSMIYFNEKGDFRIGKVKPYPEAKDFVIKTPFCHAPCMVRKEAYDAVGGYTISKRLLRGQDYHLWFKMYSIGYKGHNLNEPLYKMRDNNDAYKRRKFKYQINAVYIKSVGYRMIGLPFYYQIFALKPILVGLLPQFIYMYFHKSNRRF